MIDDEETGRSRSWMLFRRIEILSTAESFEDLVKDGLLFGRKSTANYGGSVMDSFNSSSVSRRSRASLRINVFTAQWIRREPVRRALRELLKI